MQGDADWVIVHNEYYRSYSQPLPPVTIFPALTSHVVEILVTADSIPPTWRYAGRLFHYLEDPTTTLWPKTPEIIKVPINESHVLTLKDLTAEYWLQYHPYSQFLWQSLRVRYYRYG